MYVSIAQDPKIYKVEIVCKICYCICKNPTFTQKLIKTDFTNPREKLLVLISYTVQVCLLTIQKFHYSTHFITTCHDLTSVYVYVRS